MAISIYRILQGSMCFLYIIFSFIEKIAFNGWLKIGKLSSGNGGEKFCILLVIIESCGWLIASGFGIYGIIKCHYVYLSRPLKSLSSLFLNPL